MGIHRHGSSGAQEWAKNLFEFNATSSGAIESYVISPQQLLALVTKQGDGDRTARALISLIGQWIEHAAGSRQPPPLCLTCDTKFSLPDSKPELFIVTMPFGNPVGGMVSGVCAHCADDPELMEKMRALQRQIWSQVRNVELGRMQ